MTYTGFTRNLKNRIKYHLEGTTITTSDVDDWQIVWYGAFTDIKAAQDFELFLKTHSGRVFMRKRLLGILNKLDK